MQCAEGQTKVTRPPEETVKNHDEREGVSFAFLLFIYLLLFLFICISFEGRLCKCLYMAVLII